VGYGGEPLTLENSMMVIVEAERLASLSPTDPYQGSTKLMMLFM
jgi:hypothetical protein